LDLTDRALEALKIDRRCVLARPYEVLGRQPIRLAAAVDDDQAAQLHVGAVDVQSDGPEAAFLATDRQRVSVPAEERDILAAELNPSGRPRSWRRHRRTSARRLSEHLDDSFATEVWPRAVDHLDASDEAAIAAQVERQVFAVADQPVDAEVLGEAIEVDEADGDHVHVVAVGHEAQL